MDTTVMKVLLLGYGSIGRRHARNVGALFPDAVLIVVDPHVPGRDGMRLYGSLRAALSDHAPTFAIIASPTERHLEQMDVLAHARVPFLVEKPPCRPLEVNKYQLLTDILALSQMRCAVGFQYRYHERMPTIERWCRDRLSFSGQDDLLARYGPYCSEIMVTHPIDMAIRLLGPVLHVVMQSDGVRTWGHVGHERGVSEYDYRMDRGPRTSTVSGENWRLDLAAGNGMYRREMAAYVDHVHTGERNGLATLADGLAVMRVLERIKPV